MSRIKPILRKQIASERTVLGILVLLVSVIPLAIGSLGLLFSDAKPLLSAGFLAFGVISATGAVAVLMRRSWGLVPVSATCFVYGGFQFYKIYKAERLVSLEAFTALIFGVAVMAYGVRLLQTFAANADRPLPDRL